MATKMLGQASVVAAAIMGGAVSAWLFAAPPAGALVNTAHVMSGGSTMGQGGTPLFQSPGLGNLYIPDNPGPGLGESAAQILMPAGTLSKFRVHITTASPPSSGVFTAMVRVNGADTVLTCQIPAGLSTCTSGHKTKGINNNGFLAVRVSNDFPDSGNVAFTYTLQFD